MLEAEWHWAVLDKVARVRAVEQFRDTRACEGAHHHEPRAELAPESDQCIGRRKQRNNVVRERLDPKGAQPFNRAGGITIGVLPWDKLQLEIGYDLFLPTQNPLLFLLNAKLGTPENTFFNGSPSLAAGIFGMGIKGKSSSDLGTSYDILYGQIQKNLPFGGYVSAGGYYGAGTKELWQVSATDTAVHRAGFMGAVSSPDINVNLPGLKKLIVVADVQSGKNVYGAAGGGVYFYFNDLIDILTGPVYFFDSALQPGGKNWMWTVQLDVDILIKPVPPAPSPAAEPAPTAAPAVPAPAAPSSPAPAGDAPVAAPGG